MKNKVILFDLDGTLLPMNQDLFVKYYFGALAKKLAPYGYEPEKLVGAIMKGIEAMVKNNGLTTNEEVFWNKFEDVYKKDARKDEVMFSDFYINEFVAAKSACDFNEKAQEVINILKGKGYRLILATNPIFPAIATKQRIKWAGLNEDDFELVTTYENSSFCKPNLKYYLEICSKINVNPSDCVMVGNDVNEDMIAEELGMKVFLLKDCLLNKNNKDINLYPNGSFDELIEFINKEL